MGAGARSRSSCSPRGATSSRRPRARSSSASRPSTRHARPRRSRRARRALYEEAARAWEAQGRPHDAAESRLEGLLVRAREPGRRRAARSSASSLPDPRPGDAGLGEHAALAELVRGAIAHAAGDEEAARRGARRGDRAGARRRAARVGMASARRARAARGGAGWHRDGAARHRVRARDARGDGRQAAARSARGLLGRSAPPRPSPGAHRDRSSRPRRSAGRPGASARARRALESTSLGARPAEDRLARILEITRELASEHDVPRLLQRVTDHAVALLGAERGFVSSWASRGSSRRRPRARARAATSRTRASRARVAERVVESGEPVVTISARDDERLAEAVSVHQLMIQSIACVPIRGAPPVGRTIGALYVETRLRPGVRFQDELPTLARVRRPGRDRDRERAPPRGEPRPRRRARARERRARGARATSSRGCSASAPSSSPRRGAT